MKAGIAGAGIIGRLLALELSDAGWEVTLFDKDFPTGNASCAMAAAGMLAPVMSLAQLGKLIYDLGLKSLKLWPAIIKKLNHPCYFQQTGTIVTAHTEDQAEVDQFLKNTLKQISNKNIYTHLAKDELLKLEPELTKLPHSYYFPQEGHLDTQQCMHELEKTLLARKVSWHAQTTVTNLQPGKIILQDSTFEFDRVFDCRGLGAKESWKNLRGVRGELIWVHAPDVNIQHPIHLFHHRYGAYIVPRENNIYVIGASEIESEDMSNISVRTTLQLLSAAYSLHPGFIEARIIKSMVNCRPAFPDNIPKIYFTNGLIAINGLYRHGFSIGPAIISEVMQLLTSDSFNSTLVVKNDDDYHIK